MNSEYKYKSLPLTPAILAEIMLLLFDGKLAETKTLFSESLSYHLTNGGEKPNSTAITDTTSKAFQVLKAKGVAQSPSRGYWRIGQGQSLTEKIEVDILPIEDSDIKIDYQNQKMAIADVVMGEGKSAVYVYYLPLYCQMAKDKNEPFWPCKVGRTDGDPLQRILSQASTALPEKPHVAIVIWTNLPVALENAIHSILTLRGRKMDSSPGTEWYLTCPSEVIRVFEFIGQNQSSILNDAHPLSEATYLPLESTHLP